MKWQSNNCSLTLFRMRGEEVPKMPSYQFFPLPIREQTSKRSILNRIKVAPLMVVGIKTVLYWSYWKKSWYLAPSVTEITFRHIKLGVIRITLRGLLIKVYFERKFRVSVGNIWKGWQGWNNFFIYGN